MKLEINQATKLSLEALKNKILFTNGHLIAIKDFKIQEVLIPASRSLLIFKRPERKKYYLTDIKVVAYHGKSRTLGEFSEDGYTELILCYDLHALRNAWCGINEQLNAFGFEIKEIKTV
jgi:hypothetical protein